MKTRTLFKFIALLLNLMAVAVFHYAIADGNASQRPQNSTQFLDRRISAGDEIMHLESDLWPDKILEICHKSNIPCGVEESPDDYINRFDASGASVEKLGLNWANSNHTVRELLNTIVSGHPAYKWEIQDGVLNIIPQRGHEYQRWWKPILSSHLRHFDVVDMPLRDVGKKVCADAWITWPLPSLSDFISQFAQRQSLTAVPTGPQMDKITLHLQNATVKEVLNETVRKNGEAVWFFDYDQKQHVYTIHVN
jgi:hypothetical protein